MPQMMSVELSCHRNMMFKNFLLYFSPTCSQTLTEMEHYGSGKPMAFTMQWQSGPPIYRDLIVVCNEHQSLQKFLNVKNANNKVNRWSLELATYNITFEWISATTPTASINMLVTSTPDEAMTHTQSKTCNPTDTTSPADKSTTDKVNAPPPLTEDEKDTLG